MNERRRNWILIWISLIGIVYFLRFWPNVEPPFDWDWRAVADGPFAESVEAAPNQLQPVRFLGRGPGATYGVELLHTLGLLGVASGSPPSHANGRAEVWVVPSERCTGAAALQAHLDAGGALVLIAPCQALSVALGLPPPVLWALPAPEASADLSPGRRARNLPLPQRGGEWIEPAEWETLVRRVGGGTVAMQKGRLVATSFDLVAWLRLLRQGDPSYADIDRDGQHGFKPNDLRPFPWSGLAWRQPSADVWTELLAWMVGERLQKNPLPRLWPLPDGARSALVLTIDQDFAPNEWVDPMLARAEGVDGEATVLTTVGTRQTNDEDIDGDGGELLSPLGRQKAKRWGHGFGAHPNAAGLGDPKKMAAAIALQRERLDDVVPEGELRVVRHHYLRWWGHDAPVQHLSSLGYWMELNLVSIDPDKRGPGFQFGSARPARWQLPTGAFLPILSQPTSMEDDVIAGELGYSAGLSPEQAALATAHLMDAGLEWGVPIVANLHPLIFAGEDGVLFDGVLAAAVERGMPVVSAERWATWSWRRLEAAGQAQVRPTPTGWTVQGGSDVPLQVWAPGEDCGDVVPFSPLAPAGCRTHLTAQ